MHNFEKFFGWSDIFTLQRYSILRKSSKFNHNPLIFSPKNSEECTQKNTCLKTELYGLNAALEMTDCSNGLHSPNAKNVNGSVLVFCTVCSFVCAIRHWLKSHKPNFFVTQTAHHWSSSQISQYTNVIVVASVKDEMFKICWNFRLAIKYLFYVFRSLLSSSFFYRTLNRFVSFVCLSTRIAEALTAVLMVYMQTEQQANKFVQLSFEWLCVLSVSFFFDSSFCYSYDKHSPWLGSHRNSSQTISTNPTNCDELCVNDFIVPTQITTKYQQQNHNTANNRLEFCVLC